MSSPCSLNSGARPGCARLPVELDRRGRQLERHRRPTSRSRRRSRWRRSAGPRRPRGCPAPWSTGRRRPRARSRHSSAVRSANAAARSSVRLAALAVDAGGVGEALVGGQLGPADERSHSSGQYFAGLQAARGTTYLPSFGRGRCPTSGLPGGLALGGGRPTGCRAGATARGPAPIDHMPDAQQRHVDGGGLAGALAVEQRAHDPAGDGHGADRVAEGGRGRRRHVSSSGCFRPMATPDRHQ